MVIDDPGGDAPPILFNHSRDAGDTQFVPLADELRRVYRTVRWQPTTAGPTPDDPDALWDAARQLFVLLDDLGIERAIVVGADDGGEVAVRAALLHPDRIRALALIHTVADADDVADRLDELAMPVVVLHGDDEVAAARAHAIIMAVSDPRGTVEMAGAAAQLTQTHHQVVTSSIRTFIEGLPA